MSDTFYDLEIHVTSLQALDFIDQPGWVIKLNQSAKDRIKDPIDSIDSNKRISSAVLDILSEKLFPDDLSRKRVSIFGLFDRGKTFIASKLLKETAAQTATTKGISIKVPKQGSFILIDPKGSSAPLTIDTIKEQRKLLEQPVEKRSEFIKLNADEDLGSGEVVENPNIIGDNSHLVVGEVAEAAEVINNDFVIPADIAKAVDETDRRKQEIEEADRIRKIAQKARDKAIISKQATEVIMQDLIFKVSDVVILVVNELTFEDQITCDYLVRKLSEEIKSVNKERTKTLYIVHNFKSTTDKKELDFLVDKYVKGCFIGDESSADVVVVDPKDNKTKKNTNTNMANN